MKSAGFAVTSGRPHVAAMAAIRPSTNSAVLPTRDAPEVVEELEARRGFKSPSSDSVVGTGSLGTPVWPVH